MDLRDDGACIDGSDSYSTRRYYALAEDQRGEHRPYPVLLLWARWLFDLRLWYTRRSGRKAWIRGINWFYRCPLCQAPSFFTFRRQQCYHCYAVFTPDMQIDSVPLLSPQEEVSHASTV